MNTIFKIFLIKNSLLDTEIFFWGEFKWENKYISKYDYNSQFNLSFSLCEKESSCLNKIKLNQDIQNKEKKKSKRRDI